MANQDTPEDFGMDNVGKTYADIYTEEAIRDLSDAGIEVPAEEDFTCHTCVDNMKCHYSWDLYNTAGDCLQSK